MTSTTVDLRKVKNSASTVLLYRKDDVCVSTGELTSVTLGPVQFYFDARDVFLADLRQRLQDGSAESGEVSDATLRRAAELCTPEMIGLLIDAVTRARQSGIIEGREDMAADVRALLGMPE